MATTTGPTRLSPAAEAIRRRLAGVPVVAPPPEPEQLDDRDLGALAALAWAPRPSADEPLAQRLREVLRLRAPRFDEASAGAALHALAASARRAGETASDAEAALGALAWVQRAAGQVVAGSEAGLTPPVRDALAALVACGLGRETPLSAALRSCVGQASAAPADAFDAREREFICGLSEPRDRIALAQACTGWRAALDDDALTPRGTDPLALVPGYLEFAEAVVRDALVHVRRIQGGESPYAADGAFTVEGAQVVRNALQAGLDQDAPWALSAAGPLFAGVSVAPNDEARTVPSQSAAIAFAKAIAERPSTGAVAEMKRAVGAIRHAGVKKKCARLLKTAERRLFERDDFLLELDPQARLPRSLSSTVVRALEALLLAARPIPFETWMARVLGHRAVAPLASALVWRIEGHGDVLAVRRGRGWSLEGVDGRPVEPAGGSVSLWHPLDPEADADGWRAAIVARAIEQPFNQVFRETYTASSIAPLLQPELDVRTLLGLAHSQGWALRAGGSLVRRVGDVRIELDAGHVYPGASGSTRCFALQLHREARRDALEPASAPPKALSECLRAVDLLVSVSAFALAPTDADTASARARKAALSTMLGADPAAHRPYVDGRRVRVGDVSISIATGRATRAGAELRSLDSAGSAVTVVPYPDPILRRIVAAVNAVTEGALAPG